jgi:hypothetical protein
MSILLDSKVTCSSGQSSNLSTSTGPIREDFTRSTQGTRYPSTALNDGRAPVRWQTPNPGTTRLVLRLPPRRKPNAYAQPGSVSSLNFSLPKAAPVACHTPAYPFNGGQDTHLEEQQALTGTSSLSSSASVGATSPASHLEIHTPPSPIRMPSPPFQGLFHLDDHNHAPYQGANPSLSDSMLDVSPTTNRAVFEVGKEENRKRDDYSRGKNKPWAFIDYPRGETPIRELMGGPEGSPSLAGEVFGRRSTASSLHEDGDSDRSEGGGNEDDRRGGSITQGVPISCLATTNEHGRWICEWKGCSRTFARNDHLVRHVRVAHLRLRSTSRSSILYIDL